MATRASHVRKGVTGLLSSSRSQPAVHYHERRAFTRALATEVERTASSSTSSAPQSSNSSAGTSADDTLSTFLLLSRPPTVQRSPTPFESAYYAYNSKIQRTLSQPFVRDLYFKKGSATETSFDKDERERVRRMEAGGPPLVRHVEAVASPDSSGEASSPKAPEDESAGNNGENDIETYRTVPRTTKADASGDFTSLERSLDRTLYLLVRGGSVGKDWTLPSSEVHKRNGDALHKEAPQALHDLLGKDMDVWMVTNVPVGVTTSEAKKGYIMRAHILAGRPSRNAKGVECAWVTSDEIKQRLPEPFYEDVRDLLST